MVYYLTEARCGGLFADTGSKYRLRKVLGCHPFPFRYGPWQNDSPAIDGTSTYPKRLTQGQSRSQYGNNIASEHEVTHSGIVNSALTAIVTFIVVRGSIMKAVLRALTIKTVELINWI